MRRPCDVFEIGISSSRPHARSCADWRFGTNRSRCATSRPLTLASAARKAVNRRKRFRTYRQGVRNNNDMIVASRPRQTDLLSEQFFGPSTGLRSDRSAESMVIGASGCTTNTVRSLQPLPRLSSTFRRTS